MLFGLKTETKTYLVS